MGFGAFQLILILLLFALGACERIAVAESYRPAVGCPADSSKPPLNLYRWPYLQSAATDSVVIAWATLRPGSPAVRYGPDGYDARVSAETNEIGVGLSNVHMHAARVTGLEPGTRYCYQVLSGGEVLAGGLALRTAPASGTAPVDFLVVGDFGSGSGAQGRIRDRMLGEKADLWITTGDNVYVSGTFAEFEQRFFRVYRDLLRRTPIFPSAGNHDYRSASAEPYLANFVLPENAWRAQDRERYYSFDWGAVHFVALDTERPLRLLKRGRAGDDMLAWLEADLASAKRPWKIAYMHKPAYSAHCKRDGKAAVRDSIVPILEEHGVDVVFTGHNHHYVRFTPIRAGKPVASRDGGILHITTGGGGAKVYKACAHPLLDVSRKAHHYLRVRADECRLAIEAVDTAGKVFDRTAIDRCAR